jgi:NTE family protein
VLPPIICGTSVGAINGAWTAAHLGAAAGAHQLSEFWTELSLDNVYRFVALDLLRSPGRILRGGSGETKALVDASPLHQLVRDRFPAKRLEQVVSSGALEGLVLAATETHGGQCVHFVDGKRAKAMLPAINPSAYQATQIQADHILASCAIPFLFPPIQIGDQMLVDGSLRQNTPLKPALLLGATHCLVIGTKGHREPVASSPLPSVEPTAPFLLGKALNALLLDPVHADIHSLELVNSVIRAGRTAYGPGFEHTMNQGLTHPLREVEVLYLRPSRDLGRVAAEAWDPDNLKANRATRMLLSAIAEQGVDGESDLLSYLLFDGTFCRAIEELGYEDAQRRGSEIASFLAAATENTN